MKFFPLNNDEDFWPAFETKFETIEGAQKKLASNGFGLRESNPAVYKLNRKIYFVNGASYTRSVVCKILRDAEENNQ